MKLEEMIRKEYDRVWNNFEFSFKIYAGDRSLQQKVCQESLEACDKLMARHLAVYKVCNTKLHVKYKYWIRKNYERIK